VPSPVEGKWLLEAFFSTLRRYYTPAKLIKVLAPPELEYLCELCTQLQELRLCEFLDEEELIDLEDEREAADDDDYNLE